VKPAVKLRGKLIRLVALAAAFLMPAAAHAQAQPAAWPSRPITLTMGFPPGSGTDVVARTLQPLLDKALNQRIIIDYRPGAGGNVASEVMSNAKPDGYSFLLGTAGTHGINQALYRKLSFDVERDFTPISTLVDISNVLMINPKAVDARDVKDFIARVKAAPGKYNYASTGNGAGTHLAFAEFNAKAGLDMVHVPYKGSPEAVQSVLNGDTCCLFSQVQIAIPQAGKVKLLGVSTKERVPALPDVPTIDEAGLPGFESYTWFGIFGPKGLPTAIAEKMNLAIKAALADPEVRKKLIDLGDTPRYETLEQFKETVHRDRLKWADVVKQVGAQVD
jgi:tripartite-type tricarboxylate transporter receptor subunit TctC